MSYDPLSTSTRHNRAIFMAASIASIGFSTGMAEFVSADLSASIGVKLKSEVIPFVIHIIMVWGMFSFWIASRLDHDTSTNIINLDSKKRQLYEEIRDDLFLDEITELSVETEVDIYKSPKDFSNCLKKLYKEKEENANSYEDILIAQKIRKYYLLYKNITNHSRFSIIKKYVIDLGIPYGLASFAIFLLISKYALKILTYSPKVQ